MQVPSLLQSLTTTNQINTMRAQTLALARDVVSFFPARKGKFTRSRSARWVTEKDISSGSRQESTRFSS